MRKTIVTLVFLHEFFSLFGPDDLNRINDQSLHLSALITLRRWMSVNISCEVPAVFCWASKMYPAMMLLHGWLKTRHFDIWREAMKLFCGGMKKPMQFLSRSWWRNISPWIIKQIHQFVSLMFHSCGRNIHDLKSRVLKPRLSPWGGHGCRSGTAELGLLAFAEGLGGAAAAFNSAHLWSQRFPFYGGRGDFFFGTRHGKTPPPPKKKHKKAPSATTPEQQKGGKG